MVQMQGAPSAPPKPQYEYWCTVREDGWGVCMPTPGDCEVRRDSLGGAPSFAGCARFPEVVCGVKDCFTTATACADSERLAGRDARACTVQR